MGKAQAQVQSVCNEFDVRQKFEGNLYADFKGKEKEIGRGREVLQTE